MERKENNRLHTTEIRNSPGGRRNVGRLEWDSGQPPEPWTVTAQQQNKKEKAEGFSDSSGQIETAWPQTECRHKQTKRTKLLAIHVEWTEATYKLFTGLYIKPVTFSWRWSSILRCSGLWHRVVVCFRAQPRKHKQFVPPKRRCSPTSSTPHCPNPENTRIFYRSMN